MISNFLYSYTMRYWHFLLILILWSCTAEKSILNPIMPPLKNRPTDSMSVMQQTGFDYSASGNTIIPWQFQMNFDDSMIFQNSGGARFVVRTPQPVLQGKNYFFKTNTVLGETEISILMTPCPADNIIIKAGGQSFSGCGKFLYNPQLHGTWEMNAIGSEKLFASNFKLGLPVFQLDLNKMTIAAHNGDNYISGRISVIGKRIELTDIQLSPGYHKNKISREVIDLLQGFLSKYELSSNNLNITLRNDMVVYFNKKFGLIP